MSSFPTPDRRTQWPTRWLDRPATKAMTQRHVSILRSLGFAILLPLVLASTLSACSEPAPAKTVTPAVFYSEVQYRSANLNHEYFAQLRPRIETELAFRTGGKIIERRVERGSKVRQGQVLAVLDPTDYRLAYQAALEQERAASVDARQSANDAARFQRLSDEDSVAAADAEALLSRSLAAQARWTQAKQQTTLAKNRLDYTELRAAFDGTVTQIRFELGQTVAEGQMVLTLSRPDSLEVEADLPEAMMQGLERFRAELVLGSDSTAKPLALKLREQAPSANPVTRTFRVRYSLPNANERQGLAIGQSGTLRLSREQGELAKLPVSALVSGGKAATPNIPTDTPFVWLIDPSTSSLKAQAITVHEHDRDAIWVSGLQKGALVVSVGAHKLDAGMKVRPVARPQGGTQ